MLSKKQIEIAAILYAASVVYTAMDSGAFAENLSDRDNERLNKKVSSIGLQLIGNNKSLLFNSIDDIVEYVKKNVKK